MSDALTHDGDAEPAITTSIAPGSTPTTFFGGSRGSCLAMLGHVARAAAAVLDPGAGPETAMTVSHVPMTPCPNVFFARHLRARNGVS